VNASSCSILVRVGGSHSVGSVATIHGILQNSCDIMYLRNMVCFKHVIVTTLHKIDNEISGINVINYKNNKNNNKVQGGEFESSVCQTSF